MQTRSRPSGDTYLGPLLLPLCTCYTNVAGLSMQPSLERQALFDLSQLTSWETPHVGRLYPRSSQEKKTWGGRRPPRGFDSERLLDRTKAQTTWLNEIRGTN